MSSGPFTRSQSEQRTATVQNDSSDIDVVNLSSQLVSMEILPQKEPSRKNKKRVRFSLPEDADEIPPSEPKRKKSPDDRIKKKYRIKKPIIGKAPPTKKLGSTDDNGINNGEQTLAKKSFVLSTGDEFASSECIQENADKGEHVAMDRNGNCVIQQDDCKSVKRSNFVLRKNKSAAIRCNGKHQRNGQCLKKRKVVVSKKVNLKKKRLSKRSRKRKYGNYGLSNLGKAKKRKVCGGKVRRRKKGQRYKNKVCKTRCRKSASKQCQSRSRSRGSSSKVRSVKSKVRKSADKISKNRTSKQRLKKSQYKERMKKAEKKKIALKKSAAKKRKKSKLKYKMQNTKAKAMHSNKKKAPRRRKIRIIKIERELDVVEPLRISLLKYLTFEEAYKMKWDCCHRYCWDDWEEIDMFDIVDDHD